MKVYDAIAAALVAEDVKVAFNVPDEITVHLVQALDDVDVRIVRPRHEQNAVLMADGYARVAEQPGVCVIGPGPALAHTGTGLVTAARHRSPVLVLVGRTPPARGIIKHFDAARYAATMEVGYYEIRRASLAADLREVFRRLRRGHGPLLATFPAMEELLADVPGSWAYEPSSRAKPAPVEIDPSSPAIEEAAAALASAHRPIIVAGRGAVAASARDEIIALADRMDALLATSLQARSYFRDHPRNIGVIGSLASPATSDLVAQADCILAVGMSLNYYQTGGGPLAPGARVFQIDSVVDRVDEFSPAERVIVADALAAVRALNRCLAAAELSQTTAWSSEAAAAQIAAAQTKPVPHTTPSTDTLPVTQLLSEVDALLPEDRIVVQDAGLFGFYALEQLSVPRPQSWVWTLDFGSIGLSLPMAIGASLASPETRCVVVCGDGGLLMNVQEIETLVRESVPVTVIVCNDRAFGAEVRFLRQHNKPIDMALFGDVDIAAVARAFGAAAITVRSVDDLTAAKDLLADASQAIVIDAKVTEDDPHPTLWK